jgi:hypothetical protein
MIISGTFLEKSFKYQMIRSTAGFSAYFIDLSIYKRQSKTVWRNLGKSLVGVCSLRPHSYLCPAYNDGLSLQPVVLRQVFIQQWFPYP